MMNKRDKIFYYVFTGLFTALMGMGVSQYIFNQEVVLEAFSNLGFPNWLIYPMAIAKSLGLIALWAVKSDTLKQWAYAGFTYNLLIAIGAHLAVNDNEFSGAVIAFALLTGSYIFYNRLKSAA